MTLHRCLCLTVVCLLLTGRTALAVTLFDPPSEVTLTPHNARVQVTAQARVTLEDGAPVCVLFVPDDAVDIAFSPVADDVPLASWRVERVTLPDAPDSALSQRRARLLESMDALRGQARTTQARIALWTTPPTEAQSQEVLDARAALLRERVPEATATLAQQERALKALEKEFATLPEAPQTVQRVILRLRAGQSVGATLPLRFAYTLPRCGWQPIYSINAAPDALHLRMDADITHYSGMDWKDTRLTLVTGTAAPLAPPPVRPWLIHTDKNRPPPAHRAAFRAEGAPMRMMQAEDSAPVYTESAALASWTLERATLPEGASRLTILHEVWHDPVQRIARPAQDSAPVWITARHVFTGTPLPAGRAHYFLEGSALGEGDFTPRGDAVELFFGADPLLSVQTAKDTRLTGTSGVINKRQTVAWGWLYTVTNQRSAPVTVRLEGAAPQTTDAAMTCTISSDPPVQRGENHSVHWNVSVPARGKAEVRYAVSISAPQDMQLYPGR